VTGSQNNGNRRRLPSGNLPGTDDPTDPKSPANGRRSRSRNRPEPVPRLTVPRIPPEGEPGTKSRAEVSHPLMHLYSRPVGSTAHGHVRPFLRHFALLRTGKASQ
jgi:hypothetical protein